MNSLQIKEEMEMNEKNDKEKPYKCLICDYNFAQKGNLNAHVESVHIKMKLHNCSICDYSFSQKTHLKTHVKLVHEKNEVT